MRSIITLILLLAALMTIPLNAFAESQSLLKDLRQLKESELKSYLASKRQLETSDSDSLSALSELWHEQRLRVDVLDRLIFYTDSHYQNEDQKVFLQKACLKIAETDLEEAPEKSKAVWPFLRNFAQVLLETKDSDLSGAALLQNFFEHSTVAAPKDAKSFLSARDYTNGREFQAARPVSREDLASVNVDPTLRSLTAPKLKPVSLLGNPETEVKGPESFQ